MIRASWGCWWRRGSVRATRIAPTESASQFQTSYAAATPSRILIDLEWAESNGPDPIWFLVEQRCTAAIILVSGSDSHDRASDRVLGWLGSYTPPI
jgi:hypothetical protein